VCAHHSAAKLTVSLFLPRDALQCKKRYCDCMPSVRLSVRRCPSACDVVVQDHIGWKSSKLIARTISLTPSLFGAQRPSTYFQGNILKFWVLRVHVVRPSVCLSVTLVDQDHIGWKSWKRIARTILSLTPSLFLSRRSSTYLQGNMGKFGGD